MVKQENRFWAGALTAVRVEALGGPENLFLVTEQEKDGAPACWFQLTKEQARELQRQIHIHLSALEPQSE